MKNKITLDIYDNDDGIDFSDQWSILFDKKIDGITKMGSAIDTNNLQLIFEESMGGSSLLMGKNFTFMKQRGQFDLRIAANFLTYLFFDINNINPENSEAMRAKVQELQEKAS